MSVSALTDEDLSYFVREVKLQCSLALLAYEELTERYSEMPKERDEIERFTLYTFALISHIGNLSKLFNSPRIYSGRATAEEKKRALTRCQQLRDALDVREDMRIFGRVTRNYIEHYDERLEDWLSKPDRKVLFDMGVESRQRRINNSNNGMSRIESVPRDQERDYHRYYDPNARYLYVGDDSFFLGKGLEEVKPLRRRAEKWLREYEVATLSRSKLA